MSVCVYVSQLSREAPEMLGLLEELNDKAKELHERITPVRNVIQQVVFGGMAGGNDARVCLCVCVFVYTYIIYFNVLLICVYVCVCEQAGKLKPLEDDLCMYLEVKQQMLLSYCINTTFYLMLKAEGKSVRSHPVIKQLLQLR